ncbi:hypothetical protein WJX73_004496 [Symbiochloris irregularis]|uniref:Sulfurtransferase n=1 Tax=Symbiochloris irregularis TaxID=706552 RepID=A0AAW1PJV4_9CHLO
MAQGSSIEPLVSCEWLSQRLSDTKVKVLDATWFMPFHGRDNLKEYCQRRIPGAKFFDLDKVADTSTDLPHMLPSATAFAAAADALGIDNDSTVVVYDGLGIFSAPRAWWTFRVFGHDRVSVLQGGFPAWQQGGFATDETVVTEHDAGTGAAAAQQAAKSGQSHVTFRAQLQEGMVRSWQQVLANVDSHAEVVVDARSDGRFHGKEPEPRDGLPSGHIPGSSSVPFTEVVQDGRYKDKKALEQAFARLDPNSAVSMYDGSWTEWGEREDTPKACLGTV